MKTTFQPIHFYKLKVEHHISHLIILNEINGQPPIAVGDTSRIGDKNSKKKLLK